MGVQLGGEQPPLRFDIQPVQIVGDASSLASPLLAPLSWFGTTILPGALFPTVTLRSLAPGGSFIREERLTASTATSFLWTFGENLTPTLAGAIVLTPRSMTPEDSSCVVTVGTTAVGLGADHPLERSVTANRTSFDVLYLSPGIEYAVQVQSAVNTAVAYLIQDVPAMIPRN